MSILRWTASSKFVQKSCLGLLGSGSLHELALGGEPGGQDHSYFWRLDNWILIVDHSSSVAQGGRPASGRLLVAMVYV